MIYSVDVAVALRRPPGVDEYRRVVVSAADPTEASLVAAQMAACTSVMPVWCGAVRLMGDDAEGSQARS